MMRGRNASLFHYAGKKRKAEKRAIVSLSPKTKTKNQKKPSRQGKCKKIAWQLPC
jgi:hypothetical protein